MGISNDLSLFRSPATGPYHMKSAIRSPGKTRIAHKPGAHVRLKKGVVAFQGVPVVTIGAERQVQTVLTVAAKRGEEIQLLRRRTCPCGHPQQSNNGQDQANPIAGGLPFHHRLRACLPAQGKSITWLHLDLPLRATAVSSCL